MTSSRFQNRPDAHALLNKAVTPSVSVELSVLEVGLEVCRDYGKLIERIHQDFAARLKDPMLQIEVAGSAWLNGLKQEGRISLEQYNKELEEADAEIERGEFLNHEVALKEIRSWRES